jgi:hypothetical protein
MSANAQTNNYKPLPGFAPYQFHFLDGDYNDYRPVVSADGKQAIFERTPLGKADTAESDSADKSDTNLWIAEFGDEKSPKQLVTKLPEGSTRADWCWKRSSKGALTIGPVAFSNPRGV